MGLSQPNKPRTRIFIPAFRFYVSSGAPGPALAGSRYPAFGYADSAVGQGNWNVDDAELSDMGWAAFSVSIIHVNPNAGTGNVMLSLTTSVMADGDDATSGDTTLFALGAVASAAQHIRTTTSLAASITVAPTKTRHMRMQRDGTDGGDTLSGNWNVVGVVLGKVG